jgi:hypothetical protein
VTDYTTNWLFEEATLHFLKEHEDKDPESILLSKALGNRGWDTRILARQLQGLKTAKHKFPTLYKHPRVLYPSSLSLEQASSEVTAKFKASLAGAQKMVDLSGGMGIDTYFFSLLCPEVVYVEPLEELFQLAKYNFNVLQADHVRCINNTAEEFLKTDQGTYDLLYVDPSRRKDGRRLASYRDWEPDIIGLKQDLWKHADRLMIKLSPMTDIAEICKELGEVKDVFVVSDRNECKEILLLLERNFIGEALIHAVLLHGDGMQEYHFYPSEEQSAVASFSDPLQYVYEPDVALLKAGAFKTVAVLANAKKIHPHTHLYTSDVLNKDFPGKIFRVEEVKTCSKSHLEDLMNKKKDFHVLTRNAVLTSEQVKKQYKLVERGAQYLIIFKGGNGGQHVVKAERIK